MYKCGNNMTDGKVKEFEIEFERFQSKLDHAKSQNDLLMLTLEESKAYSDRLSVLIGKYESNNTALNLALNYSDQALEAFDVLVVLQEGELEVLLANCRAAGLGSIGKYEQLDSLCTVLRIFVFWCPAQNPYSDTSNAEFVMKGSRKSFFASQMSYLALISNVIWKPLQQYHACLHYFLKLIFFNEFLMSKKF